MVTSRKRVTFDINFLLLEWVVGTEVGVIFWGVMKSPKVNGGEGHTII